MENVVAVTECLAAAQLPCFKVIRARSGAAWVEDDGLWRLTTFLPGEPPAGRSLEIVVEAARILGGFHRALAKNPPQLKALHLEGEHNRDGPGPTVLWYRLSERFRDHQRLSRAAAALEKGLLLAERLPVFTPVTQGIIHGDPKLENFLFLPSGRVSGLIDLDTVRRGTLLWELADAFRSWAALRDPEDLVHLDRKIFMAAAEAYKKYGLVLTEEEWSQLPAATRAMSLNLARRYLTDYFEEQYFAWDKLNYSSLAEQNLKRGRGLLRLAEDLENSDHDLSRRLVGMA